jgi:hypothetical protein
MVDRSVTNLPFFAENQGDPLFATPGTATSRWLKASDIGLRFLKSLEPRVDVPQLFTLGQVEKHCPKPRNNVLIM